MSYLGAPPSAPPSAPHGDPSANEIPMWVVWAASGVTLLLVATLLFVLFKPSHESPAAAPAGQVKTWPAHWNKRILPYAEIAEKERGLQFLHAVPVRFLSPQKFAKSLRTEDKDLSNDDRAQLADSAAQLRAMGLIRGGVNLLDATNDFSSGAVVGYYSFKDQRISVRGHRITPAVKETLVHELTHVLQDQHFHVGAKLRKLHKQDAGDSDDSASSVYTALVEGDAERVQHKYDASLGPKQRHALAVSLRGEVAGANRRTAQVPHAISALGYAPYALGEPMVDAVAENLGNWAVNRMFRHPPTHESAMLDPYRVLTRSTGTAKVAVPKLAAGEKKEQSGEFGDLALYLMLAQRLSLPQALAAADAWGGDSYLAYRHAGTTCMRVDLKGRTAAGTSLLESDLQQWRADGSTSTSSVTRRGSVVRLQSCDPGSATYVGRDDAMQALRLPAARAVISTGLMHGGIDRDVARCVSGHMAQTFTVDQLNDPQFGADLSHQDQIRAFAAECS